MSREDHQARGSGQRRCTRFLHIDGNALPRTDVQYAEPTSKGQNHLAEVIVWSNAALNHVSWPPRAPNEPERAAPSGACHCQIAGSRITNWTGFL